jgi:hypothetical protein
LTFPPPPSNNESTEEVEMAEHRTGREVALPLPFEAAAREGRGGTGGGGAKSDATEESVMVEERVRGREVVAPEEVERLRVREGVRGLEGVRELLRGDGFEGTEEAVVGAFGKGTGAGRVFSLVSESSVVSRAESEGMTGTVVVCVDVEVEGRVESTAYGRVVMLLVAEEDGGKSTGDGGSSKISNPHPPIPADGSGGRGEWRRGAGESRAEV